MRRAAAALGALALLAGCASALKPRRPIEEVAPAAAERVTAAEARERGLAAFARRPDPAAVREAERWFLVASREDPTDTEGLTGAIRAKAWLADHDTDPRRREALATDAVQLAQHCLARAPESARCDYWLAIALGLQARERPGTAVDGIERMVAALQRAIGREPGLDAAGPHRILAIVYLRAPAWPVGPGDPDAGLVEAREAIRLAPDHPPNLLALAEALAATGAADAARRTLADAAGRIEALPAGHPDREDWLRDARRLGERLR